MAGEVSKEGDLEKEAELYRQYLAQKYPTSTFAANPVPVAVPPAIDTRPAVVAPDGGAQQSQPYDWNDLPMDVAGTLVAPLALGTEIYAGLGGQRYGMAKILGGASDAAGLSAPPGGGPLGGGQPGTAPQSLQNAMADAVGQPRPQVQQAKPQVLSLPGGAPGAGGWQSTISKPTRAEFEKGFSLQGAAAQHGVKRQIDAAMAAEAMRRDSADKAQLEMADMVGRQEGQYFQAMNELKRAQRIQEDSELAAEDAINEARTAKIDPNRFYHEKDTLTNIGMALSVAMGSFWSAFTGQNPALETVQNAINRDIRAQEQDLANKRASADTALRRNLLKTQNVEAAKQLTRLQLIEMTRLQATKLGMDQQSAAESRNFEMLMAGLENMREKATADLTMARAEFLSKTEARVSGGSSLATIMAKNKDLKELYVPELGGVALPGTDVKKLREATSGYSEVQKNFNEAAKLVQDMDRASRAYQDWNKFAQTPEYGVFQSRIKRNMFNLSKLEGQGVVKNEEREDWQRIAGDPGNAVDAKVAQQTLAALGRMVDEKREQDRAAYGVQPAEVIQITDPSAPHLGVQQLIIPQAMVNPGQSYQQMADPALPPPTPLTK